MFMFGGLGMVEIDGNTYLTVDEVCRLLGVKPATIYAYVSRGVLRSYKQGIKRQRLYRQDEVVGLLAVQPGASVERDAVAELEPAATTDEANAPLPPAEGWIGEM